MTLTKQVLLGLGAGVVTVIVAPPLFALLPLDPTAIAALRESTRSAGCDEVSDSRHT